MSEKVEPNFSIEAKAAKIMILGKASGKYKLATSLVARLETLAKQDTIIGKAVLAKKEFMDSSDD